MAVCNGIFVPSTRPSRWLRQGAVRRKELLDHFSAALALDTVAGRLTVEVQEMLQELALFRGE